jgi:hypothetical protein
MPNGRAFDGTAEIVQPQIRPLAPGHSAAEMIALLAGAQELDARKQVGEHWR